MDFLNCWRIQLHFLTRTAVRWFRHEVSTSLGFSLIPHATTQYLSNIARWQKYRWLNLSQMEQIINALKAVSMVEYKA